MKFTVDGEGYEFDESRLTFAEGRELERVTGMTIGEVGRAASGGSLTALQGFLYVAMRRKTPSLKFSDLDDMAIDAVDFEKEDEAQADPTPAADAAS